MHCLYCLLHSGKQRGQAKIDYEITYKKYESELREGTNDYNITFIRSDDDYVFHDSKGMEAGSSDELIMLRNFIERRQKIQWLSHRLHVIW